MSDRESCPRLRRRRDPSRRGGSRDSTRDTAAGDPRSRKPSRSRSSSSRRSRRSRPGLPRLEAEQRSRDEAARAEQVKLLAAKGRDRECPANPARRGAEAARRRTGSPAPPSKSGPSGTRSTVRSRACSRRQPLVPGGAEQLTQLWRNQFVVEPQGDSFTVRTPTFQSVGDFVQAQLARPGVRPFHPRSNPGGGTAGDHRAHTAAPTSPANPAAADAAQELRRGDHPPDAGDPEESAHRSAAEPGRRHGPQCAVDGPPGQA